MEDDDTTCEIKLEDSEAFMIDFIGLVDAVSGALDGNADVGGIVGAAQAIFSAITAIFNNSDDINGVVVKDSCQDPAFSAHTHTVYDGSTVNGCATLFMNN